MTKIENSKNIVSESSFGNVEGNVHIGDVTNYGEKKPPRLLSLNKPFFPPVFMGRDKELEIVHDKLFGGQNSLVLIGGQGGIGKTAFVSKYWQKYEHEYQHLAFLYVENGIASALLDIARNLGLEFPPKSKTAEQLQQLINYITELTRPCLFILDNANEDKDLEGNEAFLTKCNIHILITTRINKYLEYEIHKIEALKGDFPLQMFKRYYPQHQDIEDKLFWKVFELVEGNTLVIEIIAKNLREINEEDTFYPLSELVQELAQGGILELSKQEPIKVRWQDFERDKPSTILKALYDLRPLADSEKTLLSIFAVLPAENIALTTLYAIFQPKNKQEFVKPLSQLSQKGWIQKTKTENTTLYKINPVTQEVVRHKNQNRLTKDCEKLTEFLINKLNWQDNLSYHEENYKLSNLYVLYAQSFISSLLWLVKKNDLGILRYRGQEILVLWQYIGSFYETIGSISLALKFFQRYNKNTQKFVSQNPQEPSFKHLLAISCVRLGLIY